MAILAAFLAFLPEKQRARGSLDVALAHQAFADQEGGDPHLRQEGEIGGRENSAFPHGDAIAGDLRRQALAGGERGLEGLEVAVVDADHSRVEAQRALELALVVHLEQNIHAERLRRGSQLPRRRVVDRCHNDEDAVGAPGPRLRHLVGVVHEILAQHWQCGGCARGAEILRPALKRRRVGQHREAGGAALLVGARQRRRIEIRADQAFRRARLLDLGDQGVVAGGELALERGKKSARRRRRLDVGLDRGEWTRALGRRDLLALIGLDLAEDIGHGAHAFDTAISRSSRPRASPESTDFSASATAAFRSFALPATISPAAALRMATSRKAPFLPLSTSPSAWAFSLASPPRSASGLTRARPTSSGVISNTRTAPFSSAATWVGPDVVISSSPSEPCTTHTLSAPRFLSTCASGSIHCRENTPTIWRLTPAGLDSGPSRLKIVRVPSSTRVGPTFFMAGWWAGANMKPMPASLMQRLTASGVSSMLTPSAPSTSAAPEREESARLPCLATGTPAPATMKAAQVEMLNEPDASPPVPTTSMASGGALTRSIFSRIAVTAPVISSTVSPRTRSAINRPPICEGVASPDIMVSKPRAASSRVSAAPVAALAINPLSSSVTSGLLQHASRRTGAGRPAAGRGIPGGGNVEEVAQDQVAMFGGDALRMELNAVHRKAAMGEPHDQAVVGLGRHHEVGRQARPLDHQRMVAGGLERRIDAAEDAFAPVLDLGELAVHLRRRAHHLATERLPDRLVAEADPEHRNGRRGLVDQLEADAGVVGRAGAG